jgi:hypothetical protein
VVEGIAESGDEKGAGCLKLRFNLSRFSAMPVVEASVVQL